MLSVRRRNVEYRHHITKYLALAEPPEQCTFSGLGFGSSDDDIAAATSRKLGSGEAGSQNGNPSKINPEKAEILRA